MSRQARGNGAPFRLISRSRGKLLARQRVTLMSPNCKRKFVVPHDEWLARTARIDNRWCNTCLFSPRGGGDLLWSNSHCTCDGRNESPQTRPIPTRPQAQHCLLTTPGNRKPTLRCGLENCHGVQLWGRWRQGSTWASQVIKSRPGFRSQASLPPGQ